MYIYTRASHSPSNILCTGMVTATCNQPGGELQLSGCVPLVEIMYGLPVIAIRVLLQLAVVVGVIGALVAYGIMLSETSVKSQK